MALGGVSFVPLSKPAKEILHLTQAMVASGMSACLPSSASITRQPRARPSSATASSMHADYLGGPPCLGPAAESVAQRFPALVSGGSTGSTIEMPPGPAGEGPRIGGRALAL